jgi:hypothetical protein
MDSGINVSSSSIRNAQVDPATILTLLTKMMVTPAAGDEEGDYARRSNIIPPISKVSMRGTRLDDEAAGLLLSNVVKGVS